MTLRTGSTFALLLLGCASPAQARPNAQTPRSSSSSAAVAPAPTVPTAAFATKSGSVPAPAQDPPAKPEPDPKTGEVPRGLPELKLELSGLHIGGGPNDAVTKKPFIAALERGFGAMGLCYAQAEQPEKGGTFGVDLHVARGGGHPNVQSVRTVMKGGGFRTCVEEAFRSLEFARPAKGPTVLSASVRFSLE